ncbi:hypothetical protein GOODEAATRI_023534 [Goodea atripinnis]|uniref:Uncharacterized protein n=1 Tax=Goodea atripinnis TaxID=208336 RepID=A0ABV0NX45_9TELE
MSSEIFTEPRKAGPLVAKGISRMQPCWLSTALTLTPEVKNPVGGTDIVSCFMGQNPTVPVYRGEIQSRNLGMAIEAWSTEVEAFEEVSDSLCVPQYNEDGEERVILFLKMAPGKPFHPELVTKIKVAIRKALSARHIPALLLETKDIPVRKA